MDGVLIPDAFHGNWKLWYPEEAIRTGELGCDSKNDEDLERFFGDDPKYAFLFPDAYAGGDIYQKACEVDNNCRQLRVSIQIKLREEVKDSEHAIQSTSIETIFTRKDGTEIKTRRELREHVLTAYRNSGLPLLRIVVAYPATLDNQPIVQFISETELLLIIDGRNIQHVLDEEDCALLSQLYNASRTRRVAPQQEQETPETSASRNARKRRAPTHPSPSKRRSARTPHHPTHFGEFEITWS